MSDTPGDHRDAAARHEAAADTHERAATFWDDHGDWERAGLQREMAEYERQGAVLERRWADLTDPDAPQSKRRTAELVIGNARQGARQLAVVLARTADALDKSAELAELHAARRDQAGRHDDAVHERQVAERTHEAAQRARSQAAEWRKISEISKR